MKILVTGASGFIGYHLLPSLADAGHQVVGLVRPAALASPDSRRRLDALRRASPPGVELVECEDDAALAACIAAAQPEACVHLAGRSAVRQSIEKPALHEAANCQFTVSLLDALCRHGCRRFVFASSVMVYGKDAPLPYCEDKPGGAPASPYGASKLAGEVLVNCFHALYGLETANLRLFSVYGPELRPDCVPFLIASAISAGRPFTVLGDGKSVRDYVEIRDVLSAIAAALTAPLAQAGAETAPPTVNVGSGIGTALLDLIHLLEGHLGKKAQLVFKPPIPGELAAALPDISRARRVLHWQPRVKIDDGMRRLAEWYRKERV